MVELRLLSKIPPRVLGIAVGVVIVGLAGFLVTRNDPSAAPPPPPSDAPRFMLMGADSHGVVLQDFPGRVLFGKDLSDHLRWSFPAPEGGAGLGLCLSSCPDAVFSSSGATLGVPEKPDPPVLWIIQGRQQTEPSGIPGKGPGKTLVYGAVDPTLAILGQADERGSARLELRAPHVAPLHVPIPDLAVSVYADKQLEHALLIVPSADETPSPITWFLRDDKGWHVAAQGRAKASYAYLSPDGKWAILALPSDAALVQFGSFSGNSVPGHVLSATFSEIGPIIEITSEDGQKIDIRQYGVDGQVVWSFPMSSLPTPIARAAPDSGLVAIRSGKRCTVLDRHGKEIFTTDAADCAIVGADQVVVVSLDGHVSVRKAG